MPEIGERREKDGIWGEWTGTTWVRVEGPREDDKGVDWGKAAKNLLPSAARNLGSAVKTIGAAANLPHDIAQTIATGQDTGGMKTIRGLIKATQADPLAVPKAIGSGIKDRYWTNLKGTIEEDPAGLLTDVASLAGGGAPLAARAGLPMAAKVLRGVSAIEPTQVLAQGIARAPKAAGILPDMVGFRGVRGMTGNATEEHLSRMNSYAFMPREALEKGEYNRNLMVELAEEGYRPTRRSLDTINKRLDAVAAQRNAAQQALEASGAEMPLTDLTKPVGEVVARARQTPNVPPAEIAAVEKLYTDLLTNPQYAQTRRVPAADVIRAHQDATNRAGGFSRADKAGRELEERAQAGMATGTKQWLAEKAPKFEEAQNELSRLSPLRDAVEQGARRTNRFMPVRAATLWAANAAAGFGGMASAGVGAIPSLMGGLAVAGVLNNPTMIASRMAMYARLRQTVPKVIAAVDKAAPGLRYGVISGREFSPQERGQLVKTLAEEFASQQGATPEAAIMAVQEAEKAVDTLTGAVPERTRKRDHAVTFAEDFANTITTERP